MKKKNHWHGHADPKQFYHEPFKTLGECHLSHVWVHEPRKTWKQHKQADEEQPLNP